MDVLVEFRACAHRLIFLRLPAMSQIFLNMFKTLRRPAIPSDC